MSRRSTALVAALVACFAAAACQSAAPRAATSPAPVRASTSPAPTIGPTTAPDVSPSPATTPPPPAPACPRVVRRGGITVTVFTRPGAPRACVPTRSLVQFTCPPGGTPVLVVDGRRRFLGGSWSRPVARGGTGVVVRGRGTGRFSIVESAGSWLSERGSRLRRLFPLISAGSAPGAVAIGDSVMLDAAPALRRALPGWTVDVEAEVGDTTFVGARVAAALRGQRGEVVFVELGTNESDVSGFTQRATEMLRDLSGAGLVVWLTVHSPKSYAPAINDAIRRVVAAAHNAVVADWNRIAPPGGFIGDGVHLNARGMLAMAAMLAPLARRWRTAAEGGGPVACRTRAEAMAGG